MGRRAKKQPAVLRAASAGAALSTVATILELTAVLAATSLAVLRELRIPLILGGTVAVSAGALLAVRSARKPIEGPVEVGRPVNIKTALLFAATITAVLLVSAWVHRKLGGAGLLASSSLAGFADVHATSISVAALVAAGKLPPGSAVVPILGAFTTNSITKGILAFASGGRRFALPVVLGLAAVVAALWGAALFAPGAA